MTRKYKQWITQVGWILYLEMWTDTPMDNLLTKTHQHTKNKNKKSCKQGYNTPVYQGIFKTPVQPWRKQKIGILEKFKLEKNGKIKCDFYSIILLMCA